MEQSADVQASKMPQCTGTTKAGLKCKAYACRGSLVCRSHTPKVPKDAVDGEIAYQFTRGNDDEVVCLDLFSGIGGISYALADVVETALYCEIDPLCQRILEARMEDGKLAKAPIHGDIKTLKIAGAGAAGGDGGVDMICGGFPCQDISKIGVMKGIEGGDRSGLFYEIMRLVDETESVKVLFLENVANIVQCGLKTVIEELASRRFEAYWLFASAGEMGAPHARKRWFCLAVRDGFDVSRLRKKKGEKGDVEGRERPWSGSKPPPPLVAFKPAYAVDSSWSEDWAGRSSTLGNSVVPVVVRKAFDELVEKAGAWEKIAKGMRPFKTALTSMSYPFSTEGLLYGGALYPIPVLRNRRRADASAAAYSILLPDGRMRIGVNFPTPRHGNVRPARLTERTSKDLATILVHCEETKVYVEKVLGEGVKSLDVCVPNAAFIEYMMGYPLGWTKW